VLKDVDAVGQAIPPEKRDIAWLYLTPNPWHNPDGDFGLTMYTLSNDGNPKWNFSNIGVYRPEMFDGIKAGEVSRLGPLMRKFIDQGRIGGEIYDGPWVNVGTVRQLEELNAPPGSIAKAGT
jgi:MurNAc alpha-1-phosphate uridylyltransferase